MIKTRITMVNGAVYKDVSFSDVNNMQELRAWLNNGCNFITIGERAVINTRQITQIVKYNNE